MGLARLFPIASYTATTSCRFSPITQLLNFLHDFAALHHKLNALQRSHILERVAFDGDEVGIVAGLEAAYAIGPAEQVRGIDGSRLDGRSGVRPSFTMTANSRALRP